jgi:hypothetical protein
MKRWLPQVAAALACIATVHADTAQEVYARGMRAYMSGDLDSAKQMFEQVLAADPGNRPAAALLRRIELQTPSGDSLHKSLASITTPKVDFREASLSSVLDYLTKLTSELSNGKVSLNLVRMFPADYGQSTKITLQLSNVPMADVLDYVANLGGLKAGYQGRAVVLERVQAQAGLTPQTGAAQ